MKPLPRIIPFLIFAMACGPGLGEGPIPTAPDTDTVTAEGTDTNTDPDEDTDTPSDTEPEILPCPMEIADECPSLHLYNVPEIMFQAAWLGEGVSFSGMAYNTLLGQKQEGDQITPIVVAYDFDESGGTISALNYATVALPPLEIRYTASPLAAVASNRAFWDLAFRKLVFLSMADGIHMFGVVENPGHTTELAEIPHGFLPLTTPFRGAVYLADKTLAPDDSLKIMCLYGAGIHCFDGQTWHQELPDDPQGPINAMGVLTQGDGTVLLAVGNGGRIAIKEEDGEWQEDRLPYTQKDLTNISVHPFQERFTIGGAKGTFINTSLNDDNGIFCQMGTSDILSLNYFITAPYFHVLQTNGELLAGSLDPQLNGLLCQRGFQVDHPIQAFPVGEAYFVLTPDALYGADQTVAVIIE